MCHIHWVCFCFVLLHNKHTWTQTLAIHSWSTDDWFLLSLFLSLSAPRGLAQLAGLFHCCTHWLQFAKMQRHYFWTIKKQTNNNKNLLDQTLCLTVLCAHALQPLHTSTGAASHCPGEAGGGPNAGSQVPEDPDGEPHQQVPSQRSRPQMQCLKVCLWVFVLFVFCEWGH